MDPLKILIHSEIDRAGFVTFERFMDLALYHPLYGYYRRSEGRPRTGRDGDYITSVSVGSLFGRLWARQFHHAWCLLGNPSPFWLIEQGAEDGAFACDVLSWSRKNTPDFFSALRYGVIEPKKSSNRARQREILSRAGLEEKVAWCDGISDLRAKDGVVFSNELVDAFPVRRVCYRDGNWREMVVVLDLHRRVVWSEREIGDALLRAAVPALPAIDGYTTEVNLRARAWMKDIGSGLKRGYIFTVDYGFPASVYYAPYRNAGTLTAYHEHRRMENSLLQPGRMDLTAHVDFTALAAAGETVGWITLGFLDQQHFLLGVAHDELEGSERYPVGIQESTGAWNMLTHPNHLGTRFQVLAQGKDAPADLSGLRYGGSGASLL